MVSTVGSRDSIATAIVSTVGSRDSITFTIFIPRQGLGTTSASSPCCVFSPLFSLPFLVISPAMTDYVIARFELSVSRFDFIVAGFGFTVSGFDFTFTVIAPLFGVGVY